MDLYRLIRNLIALKERLERVIASIEELQRAGGDIPAASDSVKRRGRRAMTPEERQEVSNRMKKVWGQPAMTL
jgi:hypothetical protein